MARPIDSSETGDPLMPAFSPAIDLGIEFLADLPIKELVPARTLLLKQDVRPTHIPLIHSGVVRLDYSNANGQEIILGLRSAGSWLGAAISLIDVPSIFSARTVTPCHISRIPVEGFLELLSTSPNMLRHFISAQCSELVVQYAHSAIKPIWPNNASITCAAN
jgi:CRP-like cAMP-binding protein